MILLFRRFFVGLYVTENEAVMQAAFQYMFFLLPFYWMCGVMNVFCGTLRGIGKSMTAMVVSLLGACAFRILWIATVFAIFPKIEVLYLSYSLSWLVTSLAHGVFVMIYYRRLVVSSNGEENYGALS
jgi:Na+-driven multidrug efflux pump